MSTNYDKIIRTVEILRTKQAQSDEISALLQAITEATDESGDIELTLNRNKKTFTISANVLVNKLTNKKENLDTQIDDLISKITIIDG